MRQSMRDQVIGAWVLQSYQTKDEAGQVVYPLGKDATGFILYTPDGYMSAQIMAQGRPAYASGDLHKGTQEEMAQAAAGYLAYSGRYEVDEAKGELTHHMELSMNPTWLGQSQPRVAQIKDGQLKIYNGLKPEDQLIWKRAEDHSQA
ncbi:MULTISPECIES: lipocalin-like domain-containing protein [Aerococcus]|uniref:Lipocalin-like domain-containing protein n=1 Tax=Aerococcus sanguinicola TaxID=119206 RepID=A0A5N1GMJ2_9LACT|nr:MULTISPECIES: lipocalin-like domain-containing protein [Aerococcus]KAA9302187.1 lipocalin-like domain-containing protein [Aerococcus sanguinicola]MDK6368382.1 lipocalin-like domain-containing protein [Aerococcus sp. UMB9870]MDK6679464.1 lipocalin-like domain-containing protein [Aerococcus sp. UMB8608]MDK6687231.1 lipocalin-like domain-containing protein [Aerococcus sp. UMB8623]MDK6941071.1 lipocalin-like domain-containing protein [Aerococcus sp. UMB8487]